jgi:tetratricopeptide (TPR) repeat protein
VLERAIERHGESVYLLANLARAFAAAGDDERAQSLIWRALQLDPNEKSTLDWAIASATARGGQEAALAAYNRAAALPGTWRAQLWLARHSLAGGQLDEAIRLYEQALGRAAPAPADLLMQLSGDLGNAGHTELLVRLTQPHFDLAAHGLDVGNNLLRAYIDLGMFAEARKLLEQLYSRQRPDWRDHLIFWEQALDDAQRRYGEILAPLEIELITLEQPVWAHGVLGFESLLPPKAAESPRIHFFCGSGEMPSQSGEKVITQPTNELGRIVRALPMFLAEEIQLRTSARTAFLLPWVKQGGFIVSAKQWTRGSLPPDVQPPDLFVYLHVDARTTPWRLILTLDHTASVPIVLEHEFDLANAGQDVLTLLYSLIPRLGERVTLRREESAAVLGTPPAVLLPGYLAALEQALAIALAARHVGNESFLHQERSIFDHLFDVALHGAELLRPRLMLVNALENETRRRPDIAREYLPKLALIQLRHALAAGPGAELIAKGVRHDVEKSGVV